jgi:signal transduction histidine kinase
MPEKTPSPVLEFFRKHWQIIYAIFLIALVPVLIVVNTLQAVRTYRKNIDITLQRQALVVGRMFNIAGKEALDDPARLQTLLQEMAKQIEEVYALDVLVPAGSTLQSEQFRVVASLDPAVVGQTSSAIQNILSWSQNEAFAFLTHAQNRSSIDAQAQIDPSRRYWAVIMPLKDAAGNKHGLLYMKLSLVTIDALVRDTLFRSYIYLAITVLVTVLVLASNTRLFQYALLFRKLKEVDQMKDEFISMASHELRAPIGALKGFISLFLDNAFGAFEGVAREKMQVTMLLTNRLGDLVEDLLNVSRIEQGRMKIDSAPVQPEEVIKSIMDEFEAPAKEKKLEFVFKTPPEPLPKINVDADRLKQVIANLVSNGIKYSKQGSVTVTAYVEDNLVKIKVTDTGLGMSPEARERLFTKFYRIQTDDTRSIPGTGLGLWITKQIVELMGGKIFVDSIEKVGTQMTVEFPPMKGAEAKK